MKVHGLVDTRTQTVLAWELTSPSVHDTLVLPTLLDRTSGRILEVYGDAAYLSKANTQAVVARRATPFFRPKVNTKGRPPPKTKLTQWHRGRDAYYDMIDAYNNRKAAWMERYGRRATIESTWSGLKRRFGSLLAAVTDRMRRIEAALKLLAWNLTRVGRREGF